MGRLHQGPLNVAIAKERGALLRAAMAACLDGRSRKVLVLMYGLPPEREHTALEVSHLVGKTPKGKNMSTARVWEIRHAAEAKLAKYMGVME